MHRFHYGVIAAALLAEVRADRDVAAEQAHPPP